MRITIIFTILSLFSGLVLGQEHTFRSIHQEQQEYYRNHPDEVVKAAVSPISQRDTCTPEKMVFGYHPYWMGTNYNAYRWNLLSDLCFFSYEVDPYTGNSTTTNGWMTTPVVDTALSYGTRVHLCATLFSGHNTFFNNNTSKQTLINSLVELVASRGASGVNLDFEAVPASAGDSMISFVSEFCDQFHLALPGSIVSMAIPSVDWSGIWDVEALRDKLDYFIIMGYDYYWNGSEVAGPVAPLYAMEEGYSYSLSRTLTTYEKAGIPKEKFILGVPYYARQWQVDDPVAPANTVAYGQALTYAQVANNGSGNYTYWNRRFQDNSLSTYFLFSEGSDMYHCFHHNTYDLGKRYDQVNFRGYAGIGIWALGYDHGRTELWDLIAEKFSTCSVPVTHDTIFDTGGQDWDHYNNEDYSMTYHVPQDGVIKLYVYDLDLQPGSDSIWLFDGPDTSYSLLGGFSGSQTFSIQSSGPDLTLLFHSDEASTGRGWYGYWHYFDFVGLPESKEEQPVPIEVFPNPVRDHAVEYRIGRVEHCGIMIKIFNVSGKEVRSWYVHAGRCSGSIDVSGLRPGIYFLEFSGDPSMRGVINLVVE